MMKKKILLYLCLCVLLTACGRLKSTTKNLTGESQTTSVTTKEAAITTKVTTATDSPAETTEDTDVPLKIKPYKTAGDYVSVDNIKNSKISLAEAYDIAEKTFLKYVNLDTSEKCAKIYYKCDWVAKYDNDYYYIFDVCYPNVERDETVIEFHINSKTGEIYGWDIGDGFVIIPQK